MTKKLVVGASLGLGFALLTSACLAGIIAIMEHQIILNKSTAELVFLCSFLSLFMLGLLAACVAAAVTLWEDQR